MRMSKKIGAMVLAAALSLSMALPAFAGQWVFDGPESWKWWYKEDNGSKLMGSGIILMKMDI